MVSLASSCLCLLLTSSSSTLGLPLLLRQCSLVLSRIYLQTTKPLQNSPKTSQPLQNSQIPSLVSYSGLLCVIQSDSFQLNTQGSYVISYRAPFEQASGLPCCGPNWLTQEPPMGSILVLLNRVPLSNHYQGYHHLRRTTHFSEHNLSSACLLNRTPFS
jgi:hypothetical protein